MHVEDFNMKLNIAGYDFGFWGNPQTIGPFDIG